MGSIRKENNWNNASKRLLGSYSHSGILGFPIRLFYSKGPNSQNILRNIFLFRNIPNERALSFVDFQLYVREVFWNNKTFDFVLKLNLPVLRKWRSNELKLLVEYTQSIEILIMNSVFTFPGN